VPGDDLKSQECFVGRDRIERDFNSSFCNFPGQPYTFPIYLKVEVENCIRRLGRDIHRNKSTSWS
jgi:hypothetical protein